MSIDASGLRVVFGAPELNLVVEWREEHREFFCLFVRLQN